MGPWTGKGNAWRLANLRTGVKTGGRAAVLKERLRRPQSPKFNRTTRVTEHNIFENNKGPNQTVEANILFLLGVFSTEHATFDGFVA